MRNFIEVSLTVQNYFQEKSISAHCAPLERHTQANLNNPYTELVITVNSKLLKFHRNLFISLGDMMLTVIGNLNFHFLVP